MASLAKIPKAVAALLMLVGCTETSGLSPKSCSVEFVEHQPFGFSTASKAVNEGNGIVSMHQGSGSEWDSHEIIGFKNCSSGEVMEFAYSDQVLEKSDDDDADRFRAFVDSMAGKRNNWNALLRLSLPKGTKRYVDDRDNEILTCGCKLYYPDMTGATQ